jgi:hypothetical protein F3_00617
MKELTKEELLRKQDINEFVKHRSDWFCSVTTVFRIEKKKDCVELNLKSTADFYNNIRDEYETVVRIIGNTEEYPENSQTVWSDQHDIYDFLHELRLNFYGVISSFENGVKSDNKNYNSTIVPFEFREAQTLKLYKIVAKEDLEKILKEGILPISKTGNDNWEGNRRADNSTEVVYLFKPLTDQLNFTQYGDVLLEVETTAYRNEILPGDRNRGKYEEFITFEVKPEEIKGVKYLDE